MAKTEHTPGPWTRGFYNEVRQGSEKFGDAFKEQRSIATCYPTNGTLEELTEVFANARLIAAAPDLLEACKSALCSVPFLSYRGDRELEEVEARLIRAIQKAEGQDA